MKRVLCSVLLAILIGFVGCSQSQTEQSGQSQQTVLQSVQTESSEELEQYKTLLSPNSKLSIVRQPAIADFSRMHPGKMTELPSYIENLGEMWQVDLRSSDLTGLDLKDRLKDLLHADFDTMTKWADKLPKGFEPQTIMELGKNPGLGIRELHNKGITGKGIGLAIIDQGLLVEHIEYQSQLKMYEEIHCGDQSASMHGPAVASIAVGKTVGVAPEADLYFIAETHGTYKDEGNFEWDLSWLAKSIDRIVEVNKTLSNDKKIKVISISLGIGSSFNGYEKALKSIEAAKAEGIYTVYVGSNPYLGLGRDSIKSPDDINSFTIGEFLKNQEYKNDNLLIPMDARCTASPTGAEDYVFYREGGMSWAVPYVAGLFALACQVNPDITPEVFWEEAFKTSDTNKENLGKIVNPTKLIENIKKLK